MELKFRTLEADEIECRIQSVKQNGLVLLLYKTARTDANILDEIVGPTNWQNDFKVINNNLYCGIGIYDKEVSQWVWKWDCGTESNTEKEKGEASDSFKRAGFKWGIGRELYSTPFTWITSDKCKIDNNKCFDKFYVSQIKYSENKQIVALAINDSKTKKNVFAYDIRPKA
jgi:hypothetical protein